MNGTIAISSSRSRSSGDGCAMPIASRTTVSSSSGTPVRSLTCRNVSAARRGEPLVAGRVEELERQGAAPEGGGHAVERDPGILEGLAHDRAPNVTRREAIGLLGDDDAEFDQPVEERGAIPARSAASARPYDVMPGAYCGRDPRCSESR